MSITDFIHSDLVIYPPIQIAPYTKNTITSPRVSFVLLGFFASIAATISITVNIVRELSSCIKLITLFRPSISKYPNGHSDKARSATTIIMTP